MKKLKTLWVVLCILVVCHQSIAQTFLPDKNGYISDSAFKQLIKANEYQLVGTFDTLRVSPLSFVARIYKNGQWLYINNQGTIISYNGYRARSQKAAYVASQPINESEKSAYEDPFKIKRENGKIGTRHHVSQKEGLPAIYQNIVYVQKGRVLFMLDGKYGLAYSSGKVILEPKYEAYDFLGYSGKLAYDLILVKQNGKFGLIDLDGNTIVAPSYDFISSCNRCDVSNNLIKVKIGNEWGLINKQGVELLKPRYYDIRPLTERGLMLVGLREASQIQYGVVDTVGSVVLQPVYTTIDYLKTAGLFKLSQKYPEGLKFGLATVRGKAVAKPIYHMMDYSKLGVFVAKLNGKYGLMNKEGKFILDPIYDFISPYLEENGVIVQRGELFGVVDLKGKAIIPVQYKMLHKGNNTYFGKVDNVWYQLDKSGKNTLRLHFTDIRKSQQYFLVRSENKEGLMDNRGNIIIPVKYDQLLNPGNVLDKGIGFAKIDGKTYMIDLYGNATIAH